MYYTHLYGEIRKLIILLYMVFGSPHPPCLPQLTSREVLCNIEVRSWLRYLSSKISNFILFKVIFWPWQLKALQIHIIYTFLACNTTE